MNQQIAEIQKAALSSLYEWIKRVAKSMNGCCEELTARSSLLEQMSDGPSSVSVATLHVEFPNGLIVDFTPGNSLGIGNALFVNARRILSGCGTFSDIGFSFVNGEWQSGGKMLPDELIRKCLTPHGPTPIY